VRETLFNWLQVDLPGSRCLDLFSGSGALGLEALSRGAAEATLIDRSGEVVAQLKENLRLLGAVNGVVIQRSALDWLEHPATMADRPYDLVFLDPPFHCNVLEPCCERLERQGYLADNAWIYIEAERSLERLPIPAHWRVHRRKEAGQVAYCLCRREAPDPDAQR
jgi:16S rRNA (guanine966-N2)-methyltransferase